MPSNRSKVFSINIPHCIFHLAVPCADLAAIRDFYIDGLGCRAARVKADRLTIDFFGHQVVFHLHPEKIDREPDIYPRHFGMTFRDRPSFDATLERASAAGLTFFRKPFCRFEGQADEHRAFFLLDPSNNVVEFKHYNDPEMMY